LTCSVSRSANAVCRYDIIRLAGVRSNAASAAWRICLQCGKRMTPGQDALSWSLQVEKQLRELEKLQFAKSQELNSQREREKSLISEISGG
jgi:hypothetical protein